jgi:hypothetical protein
MACGAGGGGWRDIGPGTTGPACCLWGLPGGDLSGGGSFPAVATWPAAGAARRGERQGTVKVNGWVGVAWCADILFFTSTSTSPLYSFR